MTVQRASDNPFPSILIVEGTEPTAPAAGRQRLYIDSTTHKLKRRDSSGTDVTIEAAPSGSITASGYTQTTARLLGRTTASTGAVEEITVGSGLSLSAGSLTATGGGALAQSYVGYNTVGGTFVAFTAGRYLNKKVTFAATTTVLSIDVYLRPSTDAVGGLYAILTADNSNAPGVLMGGYAGGLSVYVSNSASMPGAGRWLSMPIGATVPAGDYWLGVAGNANFSYAKDGSGSDQYFTVSGTMLTTGAYPTAWAITTGTDKYSIRASILS